MSRAPALPRDLPGPCRSEEADPPAYTACCQIWHNGLAAGVDAGKHAPTAEALMRSRYSAYSVGLIHYLLATWYPETAPGELELSPIKWTGLEVLHAEETGDAGVVEFIARFKVNGRAQKMHEISRFVRQAGRWYYIDGQMMPDEK